MKASLLVGGEIDVATPGEVRTEVERGNSSLLTALGGPARGINPRRIPASNLLPITAATGQWVLKFGSPNPSFMWWVSEVVAITATDREVIAGCQAAVYIGQSAEQLTGTSITASPPPGSLVRPAIATPATFIFNEKSMPVRDNEELSVIIYSPTNAVSAVSGVATVIEVPASAVLLNRM